jgi:hypothetical protein
MELNICHQLDRNACVNVSNNRNDNNSTDAIKGRDALAAEGTPATTRTWVTKGREASKAMSS